MIKLISKVLNRFGYVVIKEPLSFTCGCNETVKYTDEELHEIVCTGGE